MSSIYANTGVDLDLIFDKGTGASMTEIIDDTGQDIGYKYTSGSAGFDTGLVASSGQDLGRILGGTIGRVWRGPQTDRKATANEAISAAWNSLTSFKTTNTSWTNLPATTNDVEIGYHFTSKNPTKYSAYAFHVELATLYGDVTPTLGAPTSNDGKVWLTEIRSPDVKTKNFVVCGLGGDRLEDGGKNDFGVQMYYMVYSYITLTIAIKNAGVTTKTCTVKFKF